MVMNPFINVPNQFMFEKLFFNASKSVYIQSEGDFQQCLEIFQYVICGFRQGVVCQVLLFNKRYIYVTCTWIQITDHGSS